MHRPSVHIVEDDEDIGVEISEALQASGYDCSWAKSAHRLTGSANAVPDFLLLDLNLPDIDGFQVIEQLAEGEHRPQLVVASGHDRRIIEAAIRHAKELGLNVLGSLQKPYAIGALIALLEGHPAGARRTPEANLAAIREMARNGKLDSHLQTAFQSKRRLADGTVTGYEALLRVSVDGLPISPETVFDPKVDPATQLQVTKKVLNDALCFGSDLRRAGTPTSVSINCTPEILCSPDLPNIVSLALEEWLFPASSLVIEITEHAAVQSFDAVATAASRLAMRGCGISIDDFGRGTTSLERLFDLPLTELKIDKRIFWRCVEDPEPSRLLTEVMHYCDERDITSTVEGIETTAHVELALALGARCGQGFLWDRPRVPGRHSQQYPALLSGQRPEMNSSAKC